MSPNLREVQVMPRTRLLALAALAWAAVAPLAAADKPPATVAHIKLSGSLDETPVAADPLFGFAPENFKAKLERIM